MEHNTDLNISPTPWSVERVTYDPGLTSVVRAANGAVHREEADGRDRDEVMSWIMESIEVGQQRGPRFYRIEQ